MAPAHLSAYLQGKFVLLEFQVKFLGRVKGVDMGNLPRPHSRA